MAQVETAWREVELDLTPRYGLSSSSTISPWELLSPRTRSVFLTFHMSILSMGCCFFFVLSRFGQWMRVHSPSMASALSLQRSVATEATSTIPGKSDGGSSLPLNFQPPVHFFFLGSRQLRLVGARAPPNPSEWPLPSTKVVWRLLGSRYTTHRQTRSPTNSALSSRWKLGGSRQSTRKSNVGPADSSRGKCHPSQCARSPGAHVCVNGTCRPRSGCRRLSRGGRTHLCLARSVARIVYRQAIPTGAYRAIPLLLTPQTKPSISQKWPPLLRYGPLAWLSWLL